MPITTLQIAILRAKCVARCSVQRAVQILIGAGIELVDAVRFVLSVLRAKRVAA